MTVQAEEIHVAGEPVQGLELRLDRGAVLTGRLLGLTPEERIAVMILAFSRSRSGPASSTRSGVVTEDGYRVLGLSPGTWDVRAFAGEGRAIHRSVVIEPGMDRATLDLEIGGGLTLSGRVLLDGAPFANAQILAHAAPGSDPGGGNASTAWDGSFRITSLKAGRFFLAVAGPGGIGHSQAIDLSEDQAVSIEISSGSLHGQVLAAAGVPVAGALISLIGENLSLNSSFQGPTVSSDEQGAFTLPRLAAGSYKLTVHKDGFAPAESRIEVTPGGAVEAQVVLKEIMNPAP